MQLLGQAERGSPVHWRGGAPSTGAALSALLASHAGSSHHLRGGGSRRRRGCVLAHLASLPRSSTKAPSRSSRRRTCSAAAPAPPARRTWRPTGTGRSRTGRGAPTRRRGRHRQPRPPHAVPARSATQCQSAPPAAPGRRQRWAPSLAATLGRANRGRRSRNSCAWRTDRVRASRWRRQRVGSSTAASFGCLLPGAHGECQPAAERPQPVPALLAERLPTAERQRSSPGRWRSPRAARWQAVAGGCPAFAWAVHAGQAASGRASRERARSQPARSGRSPCVA